MHSFTPSYLDRLTFTASEVAAISALMRAQGRQQLYIRRQPEVLESLRQVAVIESSESSNRIEGITVPRERIEALMMRPTEPRDRSEREVAGYRDALRLVHESHAAMPFSVSVIRQLHTCVYRYQPNPGGHFKPTDNQIIARDEVNQTSHVVFTPTSAFETPGAMAALVAGFDRTMARPDFPSMVAIPLAILDFLCIHPFSDGNGRVGRLTTLLLLNKHDFALGRYISLERIIEESKETYYETLRASSKGWHEGRHDPHPWLNYFWGTLQRASHEFEDRVGQLATGKMNKTDLIHNAVQRRIGPFSSAAIERDCPAVSPILIRKVLQQLRADGALRLDGRGPGARWTRIERRGPDE